MRVAALLLLSAAACSPAPVPPADPGTNLSASDLRCIIDRSRWSPATERAAKQIRISLDAKSLLTRNGTPIDEFGLRQFMEQDMTVSPQPVLILRADRHASCAALRMTIGHIEKSHFCDSQSFCTFEWADIPADPKRGPPVYAPTHPL